MGKTRNARTAREEIPRGEGQEVSDLGGDQVAEMGRHVEATGDGRGVQAAESSSKEVTGKDSPVEAPDWEQETKHSCAEVSEMMSMTKGRNMDKEAHHKPASQKGEWCVERAVSTPSSCVDKVCAKGLEV